MRAGVIRVVIIEPTGVSGDVVRVVHADSLEGSSAASGALAALLARYQVREIVRLAPAAECLARGESLARGAAGEMANAMQLVAEATLPPDVPTHRRGVGVMPGGVRDAEGQTPILVTAWVRRGVETPARLLSDAGAIERWTTPAAALASLRGPGASAAWVDSEDGSITILAGERGKANARVVLEDPSDSGWGAGVEEAIEQTCRGLGDAGGVGHAASPVMVSSSGWSLRLDTRSLEALREQVMGAEVTSQVWLEKYGLALGAALVASSREALTRPLAMLSAQAETRRESGILGLARRISRPGAAWKVGIGACLLGLVGSLALAWGRVKILDAKIAAASEQREAMAKVEQSSLLYQQFEKMRWPMSKLIADVARATPEDVVASSLVLGTDRGVTMSGLGASLSAVNELQRRLTDSRLFNNVRVDRSEQLGDGKVEFELSAAVASPHLGVAKAEDYAEKPLAVRLFGERGENTIYKRDEDWAVSGAGAGGGSGASTRRENRREEAGERAGNGGSESGGASASRRPSDGGGGGAGGAMAGEPPKPLTDEEIATMDRAKILKEFPARRNYARNTANIDPAVKERLEQEVTKLQAALKKPASGGGGGG